MKKCLLLLAILSVYTAGVVSECGSNEGSTVVVQWQCAGGKSQNVSCGTLSEALGFTANETSLCPRQINITLYMISEPETLEMSALVTNVSYFGLIGSEHRTTVECSSGAVLSFEGTLTKFEIRNTVFHKCGNSTAALSFSNIMDLVLDSVEVTNSNGSGIKFQGVSGNVMVSYSAFTDNQILEGCGAGVHITAVTSGAVYLFDHCNFTRNSNLDRVIKPREEVDGGGLYVTVTGFTENVSVHVQSCRFTNNTAKWGAGLFVGFYQSASRNNIIVNTTMFQGNNFLNGSVDTKNVYNAGGGALATTTGNSSLNSITFRNCKFFSNSATWGGGLALYAAPNKIVDSDKLNKYFIINGSFTNNTAAVGSSVNLYCRSVPSAPEFCNSIPYIEGENVLEDNGQGISNQKDPTASTMDINSFPTHILKGASLRFRGNAGTPLYIRTTAVIMEESVSMVFENNTAETGGAIALYDSWISISRDCHFEFTQNTAFAEGGAIYAQQSADLYIPHVHNCFLRFTNTTTPPWDWGCKFNFTRNKASAKVNSIYATSVIPCKWVVESENIMTMPFCWDDWYYNGTHNCSDHILTSIRNFSNTTDSVTLSPGIPRQFVFGIDDLGHNVTNFSVIPTLWPKSLGNVKLEYSDDGLAVYSERYKNRTVLIQFDGDRNIFKIVNVTIGGCPPGFQFSNDSNSLQLCKCYENMRNIFQCHGRDWRASLINGYCMSYSKIKGKLQTVYGRCVFSHTHRKSNLKYNLLPKNEDDLDAELCGQFNRTGLLCGKCVKNYSIDVFSTTYNCHNCSSSAGDWTIFMAVNGLPPLILFLAILTLHINFTSGAMNGFIFFSQVVTLSQEALVVVAIVNMRLNSSREIFLNFLVDVYSFWSLDFYRIFHSLTGGRPVCLGENLRVIEVLTLHYISAVYPFLLIVIAYTVIELHARNCRVLVWLWKPLCFACTRFRRSWKLRTSVVDAFASFIILSYVKLIRISLLLLTFTNVIRVGEEKLKVVLRVSNYDPTVQFFSMQHAPFIFLGGVFVITFGILPPILLLFYQCKQVQKCLNRCRMNRIGLKTFMDTFQGCYKDGRNGGPDCRFFSGLYLIFRVLIFFIFNLQIDHIITYYSLVVFCLVIICLLAWIQPYKVKFYTNLDIFFTALLAAFFGLHILGFSYLETTLTVPFAVITAGAFMSLIPLLYMAGLTILKISVRCCRVDPIRTLSVRIPLLILQRTQTGVEGGDCGEQVSTQGVTYSEVDTRGLVDSTTARCESFESTEDKHNMFTRGRESGYGSIN